MRLEVFSWKRLKLRCSSWRDFRGTKTLFEFPILRAARASQVDAFFFSRQIIKAKEERMKGGNFQAAGELWLMMNYCKLNRFEKKILFIKIAFL